MSLCMKIFISLVLWQMVFSHEVCHDTDFSFNGQDEYLGHVKSLPEMTAFTVCQYVTTNSKGFIDGTVVNYATTKQPKAFVFQGLQVNEKWRFQIFVNGKGKKIEAPLKGDREYHICVTMDMTNGKMDIYYDGLWSQLLNFRTIRNGKIKSGGKVTLGKSQFGDGVMMRGRLRNFIIWGRKLTSEEVAEVYDENECPEGEVLHLDLDHIIPYGLNFQTNGEFAQCSSSDFKFERDGVINGDHVGFVDSIPDLEYATLCLWTTTNSKGIIPGTIGWYYVNEQVDSALIEGIDVFGLPSIRIAVNGKIGIVSAPFKANTEYYVCIRYFVPDNRVEVFVDGVKERTIDYDEDLGEKIPGGGKVLLGQRQECSGGCFTWYREYIGRMRNVMIWKRLLSTEEMKQIINSNVCPSDTLLDSGKSKIIDRTKRECIQTEHTFDNADEHTQFIEAHETLPELKEMTICFMVEIDPTTKTTQTLLSYASGNRTILSVGMEKGPNEFLTKIGLDGEMFTAPQLQQGINICLVFNFNQQTMNMYYNMYIMHTLNFKKITSLPAGGELMIGQLQKCEGGCFNETQGFSGTIKNFYLWGRILPLVEIMNYGKDNPICTSDALVQLSNEHIHFHNHGDCRETEFTLDNSGDATEYVEIEGTLPELDYGTACGWLTTNRFGAIPGTIASYVHGDRTIMAIGGEVGEDGAMMRFEVDGEVKVEKAQFLPNTEYSVCAAFHFKDGFLQTYINGKMVRHVKFSKGTTVPTGGKIMVGQLQTCEDECFDKSKAYTGTIRYFTVWGRIISEEDIMHYSMKPPECMLDAIIVLTPDVAELHSHAPCPASEFILNNKEDAVEYVEARQTLPELSYMTICAKVTTNSMGMFDGTIVSYAVDGQVDAVVVKGELGPDNKPKIRLVINGKAAVIPGQYEANMEHLLCFAFHLPENMAELTVGENAAVQMEFTELGKIAKGGKVILGQRQGCVGSCFKEGFTGRIKNFVMWGKTLDSDHLHEIVEEDECPSGHILDLTVGNHNLGTVMM